jgi:hypothetical protein
MVLEFKVAGSNPSNEGKTHVWKLIVEMAVSVFGVTKTVKRTFYIGGMPVEAKVDTVFKEDIDRFSIVERPFAVNGETLMLKWLHAKPY